MAELAKHIAALLPGPGDLRSYIRKSGLEVIFPFYHAVSDNELPHIKHLYPTRSIAQFTKDLDYLLGLFQPVKMSEYLGNNFLPDRERIPMVLSFDDGLIQCYEEIMPILVSKGVPAVFFVNNAFIDNKGMFFRFKVSLLLEKLEQVSRAEQIKAAELLHCNRAELKKRLQRISYVEREISDQVAVAWGISFDEYMKDHPVYMSSIQIRKMLDEGFELGSHGIDHPMFSLLKKKTTIDHIQSSVQSLHSNYNLDYKYFAFPFTDSGVEDDTIIHLFRKQIIDAGFGTAGLKDEKIRGYYQRVPMEMIGKNAQRTLRGEINRRRIRKLTGNNYTKR